jgi:prepilin-type N-terminal cleavage/methylation domain-containing protein
VVKRNRLVKRNSKRGFVLIEVLVAVAVAGIILVALLKSFVSTWYGISTVREEAETMMIARTLISAVTPRENAGEASQQGTTGRYSWRLEVKKAPLPVPVTPSPDADAEAGSENTFAWTLYRVGVEVTAPNGRRTTLETSRLGRP